jgi:hypothetical protein
MLRVSVKIIVKLRDACGFAGVGGFAFCDACKPILQGDVTTLAADNPLFSAATCPSRLGCAS